MLKGCLGPLFHLRLFPIEFWFSPFLSRHACGKVSHVQGRNVIFSPVCSFSGLDVSTPLESIHFSPKVFRPTIIFPLCRLILGFHSWGDKVALVLIFLDPFLGYLSKFKIQQHPLVMLLFSPRRDFFLF